MSESDRRVVADLAAGRIPKDIPPDCELGAELRALVGVTEAVQRLALSLARGDLSLQLPDRCPGPVFGSLKALHASLRHLTWQAQRIAEGDLSQRVDFMGEFAAAFNRMVQQLEERRRMETQMLHAKKLEAVGELASGIAHEINTPTQFVGDSLYFLSESFKTGQELLAAYEEALAQFSSAPGYDDVVRRLRERAVDLDYEYVAANAPPAFASAADGIKRIATIVGAMKEFAHPDQTEKRPADLNQALRATLTIAQNIYKDVADVELELGDLPLVVCHGGEMNQVFLNLLVNAVHAIEDKVRGTAERGRIRVGTRRDGDRVRIEIADTGCGIPSSIRDRVYDPFFTTKEVGRGSGQGLAIARSVVVDKHAGAISFESETGKGTTFVVEVPIDGGGSRLATAVSPPLVRG